MLIKQVIYFDFLNVHTSIDSMRAPTKTTQSTERTLMAARSLCISLVCRLQSTSTDFLSSGRVDEEGQTLVCNRKRCNNDVTSEIHI